MSSLVRMIHLLSLSVLMLFAMNSQAALPFAVEGKQLPSLAPVLERSTPAVVNIFTRTTVTVASNPLLLDPFFREFFDIPQQQRQRESTNLGSGVIVDAAKGYILTNHHVIKGADDILVTLRDGRRLEAKLVGTDPDSDVAVIQVPADNLTALPVTDSDNLRVGDFVIAIGNPFGLGQTVTSGIVSALGRSGLGIEGYEDFIQTDASINPGNSGGALINLRGELIGINTAILSKSGGNIGIGFAIPINMARDIMQQLIRHGEVRRGRLGAQAQNLSPQLAKAFNLDPHTIGAVVVSVLKGSPAEQAGLRVGDVVTEMNGRPVRHADDLRNAIGLLRIGTRVSMRVMRNGHKKIITAVIAETSTAPQHRGVQLHPRLQGATLGDLVEGHRAYGQVEGIVVYELEPRSPAARTGLRKGDIITAINKQKVRNMNDAVEVANARSSRITLNIIRGRTSLFLMVQ
ncbi:MAG: DegQ family serine endoprotease [Granulosicoccaceae bacterium]